MNHSREQIYRAIADNTLDVEQALFRLKEIHESPVPAVEKIFTYDDIMLKDHRLFDRRVIMGMVHLSLAADAARKLSPENRSIRLENISFKEAVTVEAGQKVAISVEIENGGGDAARFRTKARKTDRPPVFSAAGRMVFANPSGPVTPDEDFPRWRNGQGEEMAADHFYEKQRIYGPSFHSLKAVFVQGDLYTGRYELTSAIRKDWDDYGVHPAVFDVACANSVIGADDGHPETVWVPLHIESVESRGRCPSKGFCRTRMQMRNAEIMVSDHAWYDTDGRCVLRMKGLRLKRLASAKALATERRKTGSKAAERKTAGRKTWDRPDPAPLRLNADPPPQAGTKVTVTREGIAEYLATRLKGVMEKPPERLPRTKNFMALGIDSMKLIGMAANIERDLGIELYPTLFFEYQNIDALSGYFLEKHAQAFTNHLPGPPQEIVSRDASPRQSASSPPRLEIVRTGRGGKQGEKSGKVIREQDIAVIGMAGRFAGARDTGEFWSNLINGRELVREVPDSRFDPVPWFHQDRNEPHKTYAKWGSFIEAVDRFDPLFFEISPEEAIWLDPQTRQLLEVIYETMEDAGYGPRLFGSDTGLFLGSCFHEYWDELVRTNIPITDHQYNSNGPSCMAGRISYTFDFRGQSIPLDNACASSLTAIHLAVRALRGGECDTALAAGSNLLLSPLHYVCFSKLQMLSPTGRSRSFGKDADGYVPGEGVAALLLKPLARAVEDRDNIHAVIKGSATNHAGRANSPVAPRLERQTDVLQKAWQDAQIDPGTISYIETQGVGSLLGDAVEVDGMTRAFESQTTQKNFCTIGSLKPNMGHLEGAAGVAGVIKVILSMKHQKIPAMPGLGELNPYIRLKDSPLSINREVTEWPDGSMRSGVSAFGMTGNNTHVVLESHSPATREPDSGERLLFPLSARDRDGLKAYASRLADFIEDQFLSEASGDTRPDMNLADVAYTLRMSRSFWEARLAVVTASAAELVLSLREYGQGGETVDGIFHGYVGNPMGTVDAGQVPVQESDPSEQARYWVEGGAMDRLLPPYGRPRLVSLPTYPFSGGRYWMPRNGISAPTAAVTAERPDTLPQDSLESYLMKVVTDAMRLNGLPLSPDSPLRKYGLNSLSGMRILNRLQDTYGQKVPLSIFSKCATIREMAAFLLETGLGGKGLDEHPPVTDRARELLSRVRRGDLPPAHAAKLGTALFQDIALTLQGERNQS